MSGKDPEELEFLNVFCLRKYAPNERLEIIENAIEVTKNLGLVIIDGIRDLITNINDPDQATMITTKLMKWSEEKDCHILTVIHENKGNEQARGHIGTELINKAERILSGKYAYYWTGGVFTKSSGVKNPWSNESSDPFILMIGQSQKEALRNSSQFINAAEYGSRVVISSGEIGDYLGTRVIVSNNTPDVAAAGTAFDGGSVPTVDITRCMLMKGRATYTFVWGRSPKFTPWELVQRDQKGITLVCDYAGAVIHADAMVHIDVADA
jgi:hypothetical protein